MGQGYLQVRQSHHTASLLLRAQQQGDLDRSSKPARTFPTPFTTFSRGISQTHSTYLPTSTGSSSPTWEGVKKQDSSKALPYLHWPRLSSTSAPMVHTDNTISTIQVRLLPQSAVSTHRNSTGDHSQSSTAMPYTPSLH